MCQRLQQYCSINKISDKDGGDACRVHEETFRLWRKGESIPGKNKMPALCLWTGNYVQPNDFYDLQPKNISTA